MARNPRRGPTPAASIDDWLNLVDPDGAFLTPGQLRAAFPHGFDPMPADQRSDLRAQVADATTAPGTRAALRQWLLATVLEWGDQLAEGQQLPATSLVRAAEHGVHLRPDQALLDVDNANLVRLAVFVWPNGTRLDRRPEVAVAGDTWPASPVQRAETWCRESGVPLALVTDDDQWVLVWAPRGAPAASCRWRISDLADERILQAGFISLLGARRFFAVQIDETLEALFRSAADAEAEITKGLGLSVRRSVELLVAAISRDDVAHDGAVLRGVPATEVYEASVTVLMRLVFLLFAEERRLLPSEDPLWAESYSVLTLRDDLRTSAVRDGEDALERRSTAWHRLLATFRAVHGGVNHDRLTLPAYGGSLFDPDRFPFLEGRRAPDHLVVSGVDLGPADDAIEGPGRPAAIDDRTVLAILDALLSIKVKSGRTKVDQRVSYKALDVEQIGHCYEGLLDHGASSIDVLSLGLVGPDGAEPEIWLEDLETRLAHGQEVLCEWLSDKDRCGKSASALAGLLAKQPQGVDLARLRVACGHDDDTVTKVLPFWGLIRTDLRGLPIVLLPGSKYVTQTSRRRNMGAQYTTKALAEEVVQYALEPLVYDPGPQNEADPGKWQLRTPAQILDLRVCDPAVGSGAILTAAGRYLADRLIESVARYGSGDGTFAERLADLATAPADEQIVLARREVVDHCLYGVDKNPVAAEMAKLSLWLTTMARERPFTFLDHAIQVGDSLLGITDLEQLRWLHLEPSTRRGAAGFETLALEERIEEAADLARRLQDRSVVSIRDAADKQRLHDELRTKLADLAIVADTLVGATLSTAGKRGVTMEDRLSSQLHRVRTALDDASSDLERLAALAALHDRSKGWLRTDLPDDVPTPWERQCLHWPLAFPEVFSGRAVSGFDAMVGNPPFLGGARLAAALGLGYEAFLKLLNPHAKGFVDLACSFFWRAAQVSNQEANLALFGPDYLRRDANRDASLAALLSARWTIPRAVSSRVWPGEAQVSVCLVGAARCQWSGPVYLDGKLVERIGPGLEPISDRGSLTDCYPLVSRLEQTEGVKLYGAAFLRSSDEWRQECSRLPSLSQFVRPYINADVLCSTPTRFPDQAVVDFGSREKSEIPAELLELVNEVERDVAEERRAQTRQVHESRAWLLWDKRERSMAVARQLQRVLVLPERSRHLVGAFIDPEWCPSHSLKVFLTDDAAVYALLSSSVFLEWVAAQGGATRSGYRLSIRACVDTLAAPTDLRLCRDVGERMLKLRDRLTVERGIGLTGLMNLLHDPGEMHWDVVALRDLQVELDHAVRGAYGWSDLELDHHHWETPQGMRFTVSPAARNELLDRLLELNHQRYAEEVAAGLHDKKSKKAPAKQAKAVDENQESML